MKLPPLALLLALALLSACATQKPAPPADARSLAEPVPHGIEPLTTEQDELLAQ